MNNELYHYGVPKRSGRYPWGSGKNPFHHGASKPKGASNFKKNALTVAFPFTYGAKRAAKALSNNENALTVAFPFTYGVHRVSKAISNRNYNKSTYKQSKDMTTEELKEAIDRLRLEQQYRNLKAVDIAEGKAASTTLLRDYGAMFIGDTTESLTGNFTKGVGKYYAEQIALKSLGIDIKPKKKK